jgi:NAD(P)-dependent dehydrogenase (short-subunit alcohol dehydrogenase family)/acyl carrier protein
MEHPEQELICRRIRKVRALEALGAEVVVASVDVTDRRQVAALVERVGEKFGPLAGVIHAAGVAGGGVIQLKTAEAAAGVLAPKVQGLLAVSAAIDGMPLDFFVLCSSVNAVLGGPGQVDYCAANAFLDAFAHYSTIAIGRPVLSINWDTWNEVGMAVDGVMPGRLATLRADSLEHGIRSQEGIAVFTRLLGAPLSQVVVSPRDLQTRIAGSASTGGRAAPLELGRQPSGLRSHDRPPLAAAYVPPSGEVERRIAAVWQELLGIEQVGRHDDFFELGGHSLLAIQVNAQLRSVLQAELSIQAIFDLPTVAELAGYVERSQAKAMEDNERVLQMLDLVERLSDDALQSLLNDPAG